MVEKIMFDTYISGLSLSEKRELDEMDEQYVVSGVYNHSSDGTGRL